MATSLTNIIEAIKTTALSVGFVSVEEARVNLESSCDTQLPRLFIRLTKVSYSEYQFDSANEEYCLELTIIMKHTETPITDLKAQMDALLKGLSGNTLFNTLFRGGKVELVEADLTNERDLYSKYGAEGVTLKMNVSNINTFGVAACQ